MENHREDVIVIFAGYPEPMQGFLDRNLGMRSRIAFQVKFEDYYSQNFPAGRKCIGISSGNSMHKAGGECLTGILARFLRRKEERVDPRERTALNISFSESPVSGGRFSGDGRGAG